MANRSYLYAIDSVPDGRTEPRPVRGVSEFAYDVPLAHKLLASGSPRVVPSLIWDGPYGVCGEWAVGVERLWRVLDAMAPAVPERPAFDAAVSAARAFLADPAHQGRFFQLEAGEIFDLGGADPADAAIALRDEIVALGRRADDPSPDWIATIAPRWREELGIEWWSEVLYFSFPA